jgi:hypothetical protein
MFQEAIDRIDRAALALIEALDADADRIRPSLEPEQQQALAAARDGAVQLRQALLGAQMGPLYWDGASSTLPMRHAEPGTPG